MTFEFSPALNLLYVRLRDGHARETIAIEDDVYLDIGTDGKPVGLEFLDADNFLPFLRRHFGAMEQFSLPRDIMTLADLGGID